MLVVYSQFVAGYLLYNFSLPNIVSSGAVNGNQMHMFSLITSIARAEQSLRISELKDLVVGAFDWTTTQWCNGHVLNKTPLSVPAISVKHARKALKIIHHSWRLLLSTYYLYSLERRSRHLQDHKNNKIVLDVARRNCGCTLTITDFRSLRK